MYKHLRAWYRLHDQVLLKAHRQISKKRCFEKYCSCDQACQFWALYRTTWRSYLENLIIDGKFINKRVRLFIHQTICREEKLLVRHNKVAKYDYFLKKIQKQPPEVQKQSPCRSSHRRCSVKKGVLKNFATSQENTCVGVFFKYSCRPSAYKFFKNRL